MAEKEKHTNKIIALSKLPAETQLFSLECQQFFKM